MSQQPQFGGYLLEESGVSGRFEVDSERYAGYSTDSALTSYYALGYGQLKCRYEPQLHDWHDVMTAWEQPSADCSHKILEDKR